MRLHLSFLSVPPACLLDPSLGTHEYVTANGLKFHCVTAGDKSKPLMLFVHGFPEVQWPFKVLLCSVRASLSSAPVLVFLALPAA